LAWWLQQANKATFEPAITNFRARINTEPQRQKKQLPPAPNYEPQAATDGWIAVQNAWKVKFPPSICWNADGMGVNINGTLKEYGQQHRLPRGVAEAQTEICGHLFAVPSICMLETQAV